MLATTRHVVPLDEGAAFGELCRAALAAFTSRPGCTGGRAGRAVDDPTLWVLQTTWESVGAYRRALSSSEVKLRAVPLMYSALDEPSAFEDLLTAAPCEPVVDHPTARARDAELAGPGSVVPPDTLGDLRG